MFQTTEAAEEILRKSESSRRNVIWRVVKLWSVKTRRAADQESELIDQEAEQTNSPQICAVVHIFLLVKNKLVKVCTSLWFLRIHHTREEVWSWDTILNKGPQVLKQPPQVCHTRRTDGKFIIYIQSVWTYMLRNLWSKVIPVDGFNYYGWEC